jgi:hypothetical protein
MSLSGSPDTGLPMADLRFPFNVLLLRLYPSKWIELVSRITLLLHQLKRNSVPILYKCRSFPLRWSLCFMSVLLKERIRFLPRLILVTHMVS